MKFLCYINVELSPEQRIEYQHELEEPSNNEEYRRRMIESNFELMNGNTI